MAGSIAPSDALAALAAADPACADATDCEALFQAVRRVRGWVDAVDAAITSRVAELHTAGTAAAPEDAHTRCSGVSGTEGRRRTQRAEAIEHAPSFGEALAVGDITAEHVDALANTALRLDGDVRAALFGKAAELLPHARSHSPGEFARHCRDVARRLEHAAGIERAARQRRESRLSWRIDDDGMYAIHARLHPEAGAVLIEALEHEVAARVHAGEQAGLGEYLDRTIDRARLMAEALVDFVSGRHQASRPAVADITVLVDAHTAETGEFHDHSVCETGHGAPLPLDSVRAKLCTGRITPVFVDARGNVLDLGRTQRAVTRRQRRALRAMYRTCAAQGCDVHFDRCEIHHVHPWELGGVTDLANLLPVCSRHHHLIHSLRWRVDLAPDRTLTITDRDGAAVMVTRPDVPSRRTGLASAGDPPCNQALLAS